MSEPRTGSPGLSRFLARIRTASPRVSRVTNLLVLGLVTLGAYAGLRHAGFVNFDDNVYVYENPFLGLGLSRAGLTWAFTTFHGANWFPFTWLSLQQTQIGDGAVEHLARLKSLEELDVSQTQVSPQGLTRLRELLPTAKIAGN